MINFVIGQHIFINRISLTFEEHPAAPSILYAAEGRKGIVFRLKSNVGKKYALKVFKAAYRTEYIQTISEYIRQFRGLPGFEICDRFVISNKNSPELVAKYSELQYAILMPWLNAKLWVEWVSMKKPLIAEQAFRLATQCIQVLCELERRGLAHTDISGSNVVMNPEENKVSLVGLENIYAPAMLVPNHISLGTPGYAHPFVDNFRHGQWNSAGDRFSSSILIGEILGWTSEKIRAISSDESYFAPDELGKNSYRYIELISVLDEYSVELGELFKAAWFSSKLEDCPTISAWDYALRSFANT